MSRPVGMCAAGEATIYIFINNEFMEKFSVVCISDKHRVLDEMPQYAATRGYVPASGFPITLRLVFGCFGSEEAINLHSIRTKQVNQCWLVRSFIAVGFIAAIWKCKAVQTARVLRGMFRI